MPKSPTQAELRQKAFREPFIPADPKVQGIDAQYAIRQAVAMEYIAAQIGMIREILERDSKPLVP